MIGIESEEERSKLPIETGIGLFKNKSQHGGEGARNIAGSFEKSAKQRVNNCRWMKTCDLVEREREVTRELAELQGAH